MTACCLLPPHRGGSTARMTPPAQQMHIPGAARLHAVSHNSRVRACYMGSGCWAWLPQPSNLRNLSLPALLVPGGEITPLRRRSDTKTSRTASRQARSSRVPSSWCYQPREKASAARHLLWAYSWVPEVSLMPTARAVLYVRESCCGFFSIEILHVILRREPSHRRLG